MLTFSLQKRNEGAGQKSRKGGSSLLDGNRKGDSPGNAHYQLALLHDNIEEDLPIVIWHLRKALALSDDSHKTSEIQEWLNQAENRLIIAFTKEENDSRNADLTSRIRHLEEFAIRQKKWIEDLTRENQALRNAAAITAPQM